MMTNGSTHTHYYILSALLCWTLLLIGCDDGRIRKELASMDSLMETSPDSAYKLMSNIDVSTWSHGERMRYELMKADAQNKAFIPFTSDSTMKEVIEYFDSHGTDNEKMKAYYLLGSVYRDMDSMPKAINAFSKAVDMTDTTSVDCDWDLLYVIHAQASGCFRKLSLFDYAISENEKALVCCQKAGNHFDYANSTEQLGNIYIYQDSLVKAEKQYWKAYHLFKKFGRKDAAITLGPIIDVLVKQGRFEECEPLFREFEDYSGFYDKNGNIAKGRENMYYVKGLYLMNNGDCSSAESLLRRALVNSAADSLYACWGLFKLFKDTGRLDSALKYSMLSQDLQKKYYSLQFTNQRKTLKAIYEYSQNKQKEDNEKIMRFRIGMIIAIAVIVLFTVLCIVYFFHRRNKRRTLRMAKNYATDILKLIDLQREYNELNLKHETLIRENKKISAEHDSFQQEKMQYKEQIVKLSRALFESQLQSENGGTQADGMETEEYLEDTLLKSMMFSPIVGLLHSYAKKGVIADERDWDLFLKTAYKHMPDFLRFLQGVGGGLKPKDLYICLLVKLRFHPSEICSLMNMKSNTLANTRRRLLKKVFNVEGYASDFDMKITTLAFDKDV